MVVASFPDESKREAYSPFFVDAFMKGCRNKGAVLSAAEKHPKTWKKPISIVRCYPSAKSNPGEEACQEGQACGS